MQCGLFMSIDSKALLGLSKLKSFVKNWIAWKTKHNTQDEYQQVSNRPKLGVLGYRRQFHG